MDNTKRVLLSIQEKGVIVVIASGRPTYACIPIAKEIKVILLQDPDYLRAVFDNIRVAMSNSINMAFSKPFFLECMNDKADKAYGLNCLTQILQSSMENVIAVGDSYNDIPMIKQAGLGIAMENAVDALKQEAGYITKSNIDDGIVDIINKFIMHTDICL